VLALSIALALSWGFATLLAIWLVDKSDAIVRQQPVLWQGIFCNARTNESTQALVAMRDGTMILGYLAGLDIGDAEENPYLAIRDPKVGRNGAQPEESHFHRVFVQLADVRELWTRVVDESPAPNKHSESRQTEQSR
jgi:hypothetical protein